MPSSPPLTDPRLNASMRRHLRALSITRVESYLIWCRANGFGAGLQKSPTLRQQERHHAVQMKIQILASKAAAYQHKRRRKDIIALIAAGQIGEEELTSPVLLQMHFMFHQAITESAVQDAFLERLIHVEKTSRLFHIKSVVSQYGPQPENTFIHALAQHGWDIFQMWTAQEGLSPPGNRSKALRRL